MKKILDRIKCIFKGHAWVWETEEDWDCIHCTRCDKKLFYE